MPPLDFSAVLASFACPDPVFVRDAEGGYRNGAWMEGERVARAAPLRDAVVLAMRTEDLELSRQGEASLSGIAVLTAETLYFTDARHGGQERRQSYVLCRNRCYRVTGSGFAGSHAGCNIYHCIRSLS